MNAPFSIEDLRYDLAEAIGQVTVARRRAETGGSIDLSDLPARIERICGLVARLPAIDAKSYREPLQRLIGDLDELQQTLLGRRQALRAHLAEVGTNPDGD